MQLYP